VGDDLGYVKAPANAFFQAATCTSLPTYATSGDHHHITTARQEPILPSQCTCPLRPAVNARIRVALRTQVGERAQHSTALFWTAIQSRHKARKLQPAACLAATIANRPRRRCPHSLYLCSYRPLRSPIRSFRSRYLGGADPCQLGLCKAEGSPGHC
jgi:hypothetical protein